MCSFLCSYEDVQTNRFFFVVLFMKGPKFLLPLYVRSRGTDEIWISQTKRKPKLIPSYVGKVSCREFWHPFLRNRSRWCPDLVQIWSRFRDPDRLDQFRQPPIKWALFTHFCTPLSTVGYVPLLPGRLGLNRVSLLSSYPIDKKYNYWRSSLKGLIVGVKFAQRGLSPGREVCEKITLKS